MGPIVFRTFRLYTDGLRTFSLAVIINLAGSGLAAARPEVYRFVTIAGNPSIGSADGTNSSARFYSPTGIAVDKTGNVFVADAGNYTIRKLALVGSDWVTTTIAGLAGYQGTADGTNGDARFIWPLDIAVDASGSVFVADSYACTIRKITPVGTNWVVNTIAGLGSAAGDADGTNNAARFRFPTGVAVASSGDVFVADDYELRRLTQVGTNWVCSTVPFWSYGFWPGNCGDLR